MRHLRRLIAILLLVCYLPACTSFHRIEPTTKVVAEHPSIVVKVRDDGDMYEVDLQHPWVTSDSIGGVGCIGVCDTGQDWAVPLEKVEAVGTRKVSAGKSVGMGFLVFAGFGTIVGIASGGPDASGMFTNN